MAHAKHITMLQLQGGYQKKAFKSQFGRPLFSFLEFFCVRTLVVVTRLEGACVDGKERSQERSLESAGGSLLQA
jgi:hypothetical protein